MAFPRLQLFEFNDAAWAPAALREVIVDALGLALEHGHLLDGLVDPFAAFIEAAGTDSLLDLCAGSGAPAHVLLTAIAQRGLTPQLTLTDLHPHVIDWRRLQAERPQQIALVPTPVDATAVPAELAHGRARIIINAFHHFPPPLCRAILADAVDGRGIFIAEGLSRDPRSFLALTGPGLRGLAQAPLYGDRRFLKAMLTWAAPLALIAGVWDGFVSAERIYDEDALRAMVRPLGDRFEWRFGTYPFGPRGRGCWFSGVPRRAC